MTPDAPILLVEDNEDDVFFMKRAMKAAQITNPLFVAVDGQEAVDYFSGMGRFSERSAFPLPGLVFLDLKLPKKRGLDVLEWIRNQREFRRVVVVILTSSQEPNDLRQAYAIGVNSYLVKPARTSELEALMRAVKNYWIEFNVFDPGQA
ncbi:MAG TPA: response regulator [Verrucomicrobiae bacterium]|nr:response regulator [Verrucomicrobiae bacterium]